MRPLTATFDVIDGRFAHTKLRSNIGMSTFGSVHLADCFFIVLGASVARAVRATFLNSHVQRVVEFVTEKQMPRVNAERVVAAVENREVAWNRPPKDSVRNSVCGYISPGYGRDSVCTLGALINTFWASPYTALIVPTWFNMAHEQPQNRWKTRMRNDIVDVHGPLQWVASLTGSSARNAPRSSSLPQIFDPVKYTITRRDMALAAGLGKKGKKK